MVLDYIPTLGPLLDNLVVTAGGRKQRFRFLPWGDHFDTRQQAAIQSNTVAAGTMCDGILSVRHIDGSTFEANTGGDAAKTFQVVDVNVWWQDGDDLPVAQRDAYRNAVVRAVAAVVRANRRTCTPASFIRVINSREADEWIENSLVRRSIVTVKGEAHEVGY